MAEHLTAAQLRERLDLERAEFDRLQRQKVWPRVATKQGDRFPWPQALHAYVRERERVARAELPEFVTSEQLAELINRHKRTLHNYQKAGIPHDASGREVRYPLVPALRWCLEYFTAEKGSEDGKPPSLAKQKDQEDLLRARNQRLLSDIEVAKAQGQVVTLDFMREEFEELVAVIREVLLNLPGELAEQVLGLSSKPKARAVIRAGVDKAMTALRDALTAVAERERAALERAPADPEPGEADADDAP